MYWDRRVEQIEGQRFYVDQGKIKGFLSSHRQGDHCRVATEQGFQSLPWREVPGEVASSEFERFLTQAFEDQPQDLDDGQAARQQPGFDVDAELLASVRAHQDPHVSFRFTWERRIQTFENSLGHHRSKVEFVRVLRIDYTDALGEGRPLHLRRMLYAPGPQDVARVLSELHALAPQVDRHVLDTKGTVPVMLAPSVTSVFVHEVIGHWAEQFSSPEQLASLQGKTIAPQTMTVMEDASHPGRAQQSLWDDEGMLMQTFPILESGTFDQPVASLEHAFRLGVAPRGRGRATDFRVKPVSRMANIRLMPGTTSFEELLEALGDGYLLDGSLGGLNSRDLYQVQTQVAYRVVKGKIQGAFKGPLLMGQVSRALSLITHIGHESVWTPDGGCFGRGQFLELSGRAAPHILMTEQTLI